MQSVKSETLRSFKRPGTYILQSADRLDTTSEAAREIVEICNQPEVYKLFQGRLKGKSYSLEDAIGFLNWAQAGWTETSHFVFFVKSEKGSIAAALDVKSNNLESAEIGYWCDVRHQGITSAAVDFMAGWARRNGYAELFARPINERSQNLLIRCGFSKTTLPDPATPYGRWVKTLL